MRSAPSIPSRPARLALATAGVLAASLLPAGSTAAAVPAPTSAAVVSTVAAAAAAAPRPTPATPGDFTGYGFDQCLAPTQAAMNTWLRTSPYLAVGIYISGDSRACRSQPNLTRKWVRTQLLKGWRLLPITLGPQASCQPRFPRYRDDFKISPDPGPGRYPKARAMGRDSATETVADAQALGIVRGSTLWYDLEGFDHTNTHCRESALHFISAWVTQVKSLGYVSGVYSSAGSGIKALDDARVTRPGTFALPDRIWLARWDGVANTSTSYLREDGWRPGGRVKQYRGGHDEVWGGVRINIDTNYLELGRGSVAPRENHCGGTPISLRAYGTLQRRSAGNVADVAQVKALQCLLTEKGYYRGAVHGAYGNKVIAAARAWKAARGRPASGRWLRRDWMTLLSHGAQPVLKVGSADGYVRRVQRSINAAGIGVRVSANGRFTDSTRAAVRTYQRRAGVPASGIVDPRTWKRLQAGVR